MKSVKIGDSKRIAATAEFIRKELNSFLGDRDIHSPLNTAVREQLP
jgi:hypothetical protein